jgi:cellulose synthase/poly-beta-1,6-N-acetylglucosamine synthase-like glycosyltransferase
MSTPFVTVLIDTYNHERFIEEAIVSVLEQDFPASEMEIIVVDDGSTDRTPEIIRKFAPRVRHLRKANGGQASAFNAGIPQAKGMIVAFLDGDDWWASSKLTRVAEAAVRQPDSGLIGHSITEVLSDGRYRIEALREETRFQANSLQGARIFRTLKSFLGTSRMTIRAGLLRQIGIVPEALVIEADEYLFTMAAVLSEAVILKEPLTYYRHHDSNLFLISAENPEKLRCKLDVLETLSKVLSCQLLSLCIEPLNIQTIVEAVDVEARQLRLTLEAGWPWNTIVNELRIMRIQYADASFWQHLFSCVRLLPSLCMPSDAYYLWRRRMAQIPLYRRIRRKCFPFPVPRHVHRQEGPAH